MARRQRTRIKKAPRRPGKKTAHERYTLEHVVTALHHAHGIVAGAAKRLGCDRRTIYKYRDRHPEIVTAAIREGRETMCDLTELKLFSAVNAGQAWAICFYLKTQAKHRGYIERQEHGGPGGGPIPHQHDLSKLTREELEQLRALEAKIQSRVILRGPAAGESRGN